MNDDNISIKPEASEVVDAANVADVANIAEAAQPPVPKPKFKNRKFAIIGAIIAAIAAVGFGFWQWHETPEFCVAICHTPMDETYLQTLYANPYEPAVDKWGNKVDKAGAMLASLHGKMGKRCMSCHVPAIEEQVTEGIEWITGNYNNPLSERDLARLVYYRGVGETEFCLNPGCHDISKTGLTQQTADTARNPHSWHHSEYTCSDCHKAHRASVMVCSQCHDDAEVPSGWLTWTESQDLETRYMSWNDEQFLKA
ncbi:MAG: cytochrome c3 family protein [Eggerthellaceae bacterium]|nr:cytochrome c3 family protein [Eggerthellaceae bacterium]